MKLPKLTKPVQRQIAKSSEITKGVQMSDCCPDGTQCLGVCLFGQCLGKCASPN